MIDITDLEVEAEMEKPLTSAELMKYSVASLTSSILGQIDELIELSCDVADPDAQRAVESEFQTIYSILTRSQLLLSFLERYPPIDRYDPGFLKFRAETVPPEQRNWRTLRRDWLAYQRHLEAKKRWSR